MGGHSILKNIRRISPETAQTWVTAALCQSPVIWQSLYDPAFAQEAFLHLDTDPDLWTPGNLSLLALDVNIKNSNQGKPCEINIDSQLLRRARQALDTFCQSESPAMPDLEMLKQAGLIALYLNDRHSKVESWENIFTNVVKRKTGSVLEWSTVFACLYTLCENRDELLNAIIRTIPAFDGHALALQTLFSKPAPMEEQVHAVIVFLQSDRDVIKPEWVLEWLGIHQPELAPQIARWMLEQDKASAGGDYLGQIGSLLAEIQNLSWQAYLYKRANASLEAVELLDQARKQTQWLVAEIASSWANQAEKLPDYASIEALSAAWELAIQSAPVTEEDRRRLPYFCDYIQSQVRQGAIPDAFISSNAWHEEGYDGATLLEISRQKLKAGETTEAISLAQKAVARILEAESQCCTDEKLQKALLEGSTLLVELDMPQEAVQAARRVIQTTPTNYVALQNLGHAYLKLGDKEHSLEAFEAAFLLAPEHLDIHRQLASALENCQEWETALFERSQISQISASIGRIEYLDDLHKLASCAYQAGSSQQAVEACMKSLEIDAADYQPHNILGKVFFDLGDMDQASEHLNQSIQAAPQHIEPWLLLASVYERNNDIERVTKTLSTAIQANPNNPQLHLAFGKNLIAQNALTSAQESFQVAYDLAKKQPEIYQDVICEAGTNLSSVLIKLGHFENSQAIITPIYQEHPNDPNVARIYARVMTATHNFEAAIGPLELALQATPKDPELTLEYGRTLLAVGREPEIALKVLQNTLNAWPGHLETQALLAEATAATGNHARALEMFRGALDSELGKDSQWQSRLSMGLGLSALALGRTETALAALQEAIQLDPQNSIAQRALAEAFMAVGLHNEGWITAQTALRLDSNPDTAIWFANLGLAWYKNDFSQGKTVPRAQAISTAIRVRPEQILQEAATALRQVQKQYPSDSRLLVKLSQVLTQAGDYRGARGCLREVASLPNPSLEALENSATILMSLKDPAAAAECLEKALKVAKNELPTKQAERYSSLAEAREQAGHFASAIQALEQALLLVPSQAEWYQRLVNLWTGMGNFDRALETMERARNLIREPFALAELFITTSKLCRKMGRLLSALEYAEQAINSCATMPSSNQVNLLQEKASALFAELSWILLRPEEAQRSLRSTNIANSENSEVGSSTNLDYFCLGAELALQFEEEVEAANYLTRALDMASEHSWPLALQARLLHKQKDQPLAVNTLQDAVERARHEKLPVLAFISLANAAAEMTEWQTATDMVHHAVTLAPDEPLPQLSLAQILVQRGEFQLLCEDLEVIKHAPGRESLLLESQDEYLAALQSAETALLQAFQEKPSLSETSNTPGQEEMDPWNKAFANIARWKCRGAAIFSTAIENSKVPPNWISWTGFPLTVKDEAAHLAFLRRDNSHEKSNRNLVAAARENAVLHPQDSSIQIQASLVLASTNLSEALRYARSATNLLNSLPKHPLTAFAHVLVAHLASRTGDIPSAAQSIQIALGIWSEEARWHNLSARIYLASAQQKADAGTGSTDDINKAIAHLEEAVRLEPERASHAILLSQVIFQTASQDPIAVKRALRILEKTSRVAGNEPEIWLALSSAYQQLGGKTNLKLAYASAERAISVARESNGRQALIEAHVQLGQMALSNGEAEEAYRQARQALRINAHNPDATLLQVHALEALNRNDDALEVIEKALPNTKDNLLLQIKRGALLCQGPDPDEGLAVLENIASQHPDQAPVHSVLAKKLHQIGRKEDAIQHAQQALQLSNVNEAALDPREIGEMHTLLGNLYNELGHLDQAIYQFNTALQQHPEHIDAYLALAETYQKQRQFLKAQEVLEQAISAAPTDPRPYFQAGMAYKDGRDYESAANMLRKAAQLSPGDINIRKQLAAVMAIVVLNNTRNIGNKMADEVR